MDYHVKQLKHGMNYGSVTIPGSKSITNRALLLAAFASGVSTLRGVLFSDDSEYCIQAIQSLGVRVEVFREEKRVVVHGSGGAISPSAEVYVGSGGTTARFLSAMVSAVPGVREFSASAQMSQRPMGFLLQALREGGSRVDCKGEPNCFPFTLSSPKEIETHYKIDGSRSSQFLSGLLMMGAVSSKEIVVEVEGPLIAKAYVDITIRLLASFGVKVIHEGYRRFVLPAQSVSNPTSQLRGIDYTIEPDVSGACYFFALPVLLGGSILVEGLTRDSMQGDIVFLDIMEQLGASVQVKDKGIRVSRSTSIVVDSPRVKTFRVDMNDLSDQTLTLGAMASLFPWTTEITGVGHIRYQESDRLLALVTELQRLGVEAELLEDGVRIHGSPYQQGNQTTIETYDDHRMAMSFTLPGLVTGGIAIGDPGCCRKTFPNYFQIIDQLVSCFEKNYYLLGFMGAGKSTVGKKLAKRLNRPFIDVDRWIEDVEGATIPEIFAQRGEAGFREAEQKALLEVSYTSAGAIIATGGGIVELPKNRAIINQYGRAFYLYNDFEVLYNRISGSGSAHRPLASAESKEDLLERYTRRDALYREVGELFSRKNQSVLESVELLAKGIINESIDRYE